VTIKSEIRMENHPVPKVLGYKRTSDIKEEVDIVELSVYSFLTTLKSERCKYWPQLQKKLHPK
jgi:hypothetical protein